MDHMVKQLQEVGLSEKEARVYLASLELGEATAQQIAAKALVNRPATYMMIESLTQRGLMSSFMRGKKRVFAAEQPGKLVEYVRRRNVEAQKALKNLEMEIAKNRGLKTGEKPVVKVLEGKEGIKAIIDDVKASNAADPIEITDINAMLEVLKPEDLFGLRDQLEKKQVRGRGIHFGKSPFKVSKFGQRRLVPEKFGNFRSNIGIYGNKLVMVTFDKGMYSVVIESELLTRTMLTLFELAWERLDDQEKK